MKYTPTPFDRIRRTTCSILSSSAAGASSNRRCASSKKNTSVGLLRIADFRQPLEQLREQPEQERPVQLRRADELVGRENVDDAAAARVGLQQVVDVQHRLAEKGGRRPAARSRAARAESRRSTRRRRCRTAVVNSRALSPTNCSIARRSFRSSSSSPLSSATLKTSASTPCCVAFNPSSRPRSSGPRSEIVARTGNPRLAEYIPEHDRAGGPRRLGDARGLQPLAQLRRRRSRRGQPRQIAFHVGEKHRHADPREVLGEHLQRDGLAGAGGAGDQAVPVRERRPEQHVLARRRPGDDKRFTHGRLRLLVADRPDASISSRANSGPLPSSSCLK